jgi:hypothetical protein
VGEKHYLSDCPHASKEEDIVMLAEHKKQSDADKKKAIHKMLASNEEMPDN